VTDITYYVEYDLDRNGATTATSTYSTDSSVITACSATATTTTSFSTSTIQLCTPGCVECNLARRDAVPTAFPPLPDLTTNDLIQYGSNLTKTKRDIENLADSETWSGLYLDVKRASKTTYVALEYSDNALLGVSSSGYITFDDAEHNILVDSLSGCTSVMVVNRQGQLNTFLYLFSFSVGGPSIF
jgi:hypothetical protein